MARLMAIDYGTKRTGIAVSDELQIIATALTTVETKTLFPFLKTYFTANEVEKIIVGEPSNLNGTATHATLPVADFVKQFQLQFPDKNVVMLDERFTSKMAAQVIAQSGMNKKHRQDKKLLDQISATILLQDFMARI